MATRFNDKILTCVDCGREFTWTAEEQEFYEQKGYENAPKRCLEDRAKRKAAGSSSRESFEVTCSNCGNKDTVPFRPTEGRAVLCKNCFAESRKK